MTCLVMDEVGCPIAFHELVLLLHACYYLHVIGVCFKSAAHAMRAYLSLAGRCIICAGLNALILHHVPLWPTLLYHLHFIGLARRCR